MTDIVDNNNQKQELIEAVKSNQIDKIRSMVQEYPEFLNEFFEVDYSVVKIIPLVLEHGGDENKEKSKVELIQDLQNSIKLAEELLKMGADVDNVSDNYYNNITISMRQRYIYCYEEKRSVPLDYYDTWSEFIKYILSNYFDKLNYTFLFDNISKAQCPRTLELVINYNPDIQIKFEKYILDENLLETLSYRKDVNLDYLNVVLKYCKNFFTFSHKGELHFEMIRDNGSEDAAHLVEKAYLDFLDKLKSNLSPSIYEFCEELVNNHRKLIKNSHVHFNRRLYDTEIEKNLLKLEEFLGCDLPKELKDFYRVFESISVVLSKHNLYLWSTESLTGPSFSGSFGTPYEEGKGHGSSLDQARYLANRERTSARAYKGSSLLWDDAWVPLIEIGNFVNSSGLAVDLKGSFSGKKGSVVFYSLSGYYSHVRAEVFDSVESLFSFLTECLKQKVNILDPKFLLKTIKKGKYSRKMKNLIGDVQSKMKIRYLYEQREWQDSTSDEFKSLVRKIYSKELSTNDLNSIDTEILSQKDHNQTLADFALDACCFDIFSVLISKSIYPQGMSFTLARDYKNKIEDYYPNLLVMKNRLDPGLYSYIKDIGLDLATMAEKAELVGDEDFLLFVNQASAENPDYIYPDENELKRVKGYIANQLNTELPEDFYDFAQDIVKLYNSGFRNINKLGLMEIFSFINLDREESFFKLDLKFKEEILDLFFVDPLSYGYLKDGDELKIVSYFPFDGPAEPEEMNQSLKTCFVHFIKQSNAYKNTFTKEEKKIFDEFFS